MVSRLSAAVVCMLASTCEEDREDLIENMPVVFILDESGGESLTHRGPLQAGCSDRVHRVDSFGDRHAHVRLAKLIYETQQFITEGGHRRRFLSRTAADERARFALNLHAIVLMLKQHAQCGFDAVVVEFLDAEPQQRARPVESLRDRGRLLEAEFANRANESCGLGSEPLIQLRHLELNDVALLFGAGKIDEQMQASAPQSLRQLAGAIRR